MKYCREYVGRACIDGTCPKANSEEREERGYELIKSCRQCWFYRGCEDCALDETEYCSEKIINSTV